MKTTIDIPYPLYRQAKIRAVNQGTSLKALVLTALERELQPSQLQHMQEPEAPYFARRTLLPKYRQMQAEGAFRGGRESGETISEDRDGH